MLDSLSDLLLDSELDFVLASGLVFSSDYLLGS